ncbi:DHH family phosphoesterase [Parasporobacterium paucivorans]|uniref:DHH family phosphoesterase n=1 Tax=Parasporobacterium paucivorans TaxID=115544 RepID=UPI00093F0E48
MNRLEELLSSIKTDNIIIGMHDFPDPDSIASAFALQFLLKELKNIDSTICYKGEVDKFNTSNMVNSLGIRIFNLKEVKLTDDISELVLVDAQIGNVNAEFRVFGKISCIDHHPMYHGLDYVFEDIRPGTGSCSSIIAEYYSENAIEMPQNVATALLYGLKIDTANLTRGVTRLDLDMHYYLYYKSDLDIIHSLENSTLNLKDLSAYTNAIENIVIYGKICFADTGYDSPDKLIALVSDFMLTVEEIDFSVVFSAKQEGIKLSIRSMNQKLDAGKITKSALNGLGGGGGHQFMAGGFVEYAKTGMSAKRLKNEIRTNFINIVKEELSCWDSSVGRAIDS